MRTSLWMPRTAACLAALLLPLFAAPLPSGAQDAGPGSADARYGDYDNAPGARLLVVNKSGHSLSVLDPSSGREVATVPTGRSPHEVAVSPDGRFAYVTDYGSAEEPGRTITVVDLEEPGVRETLDLSPHSRPHGIQVLDDGTLWVTTEGSRHVLHVDPASGEILREVETGQEVTHMVAVAERAGRVYTADIGSGTVTVVDASTGQVLTHLSTGAGAEGLALSPDGDRLYVTNRSAGTLSEIPVGQASVSRTLEVGDFPIRVAVLPGGDRALVSNARGNEVALVDLDSWTVSRRMAVGAAPVGIQITPDGGIAYVANTGADRISVLDLEDWSLAEPLTAGREPDGMAWVPGSP